MSLVVVAIQTHLLRPPMTQQTFIVAHPDTIQPNQLSCWYLSLRIAKIRRPYGHEDDSCYLSLRIAKIRIVYGHGDATFY